MKIRLNISPDAEIKVERDDEGNVLAVEFEPFFSKSTGQVTFAHGESVTDAGVLIERFGLTVSGQTGKVAKASRTGNVKAAIDDPAAQKKTTPPEGSNE